MKLMNPLFLIDFYKVGHVSQYPTDVTQVWSNWTPRSTRILGQDRVVHFGLQYFIKKYLLRAFQDDFIDRPLAKVLAEYREPGEAHPLSKLTESEVREIRAMHVPGVFGCRRIAKKFPVVSVQLIKQILRNRNWSHVNG